MRYDPSVKVNDLKARAARCLTDPQGSVLVHKVLRDKLTYLNCAPTARSRSPTSTGTGTSR